LKDLKLFNNHTNIQNNSQTDTLPYILVTLHRPSNVDNKKFMDNLVKSFNKLAKEIKIVFPVHPRTRKNLETWNIIHGSHNTVKGFSKKILITEPLPYIDFLTLMKHAKAVITDSGGIQEETTFLRIPCLTLRKNTERPITIKMGTNQLIGRDIYKAIYKMNNITGSHNQENIPDFWDGKAANRILRVLTKNSILSEL
jgi:UDP-N-acetylglucosamine 2-epimerase (non-hydrolysing)